MSKSKHPRDLANLKFFINSSYHPDPTTLELLSAHNVQVIDFSTHLVNTSDRYLDEFMELCTQGTARDNCYVIPPFPLDRPMLQPFLDHIILLSQSSVPGEPPIYDQVCAIIGHTPGRDSDFAGIFKSAGIIGLRASGANPDEARRIALSHRLTNGGTMRDEAAAAALLRNILPQRSDDSHLIYEFNSSPHWNVREEFIRRSLLDHILIEGDCDRELALVISTRNPDGDVTSMRAIATNRGSIQSATEAARTAGYSIHTYSDARNGMHALEIYSKNVTFPIKGFANHFTNILALATAAPTS